MQAFIARFGAPLDVTRPLFDGKTFKFPCIFVDRRHVGAPRQAKETRTGWITVEISGSLERVWGLKPAELTKALFQIAKEHLPELIRDFTEAQPDMEIGVNMTTHKGPCPFDTKLIEEPEGATVQVDITRPIGFI